jgi:hypothetical protein
MYETYKQDYLARAASHSLLGSVQLRPKLPRGIEARGSGRHAEIYILGGAEHQGPDGAAPVALIVDRAAS